MQTDLLDEEENAAINEASAILRKYFSAYVILAEVTKEGGNVTYCGERDGSPNAVIGLMERYKVHMLRDKE